MVVLINTTTMQKEFRLNRYETYAKYIIGVLYDGKGTYLGETKKGVHKFEKHARSFSFARANNFGPKYYFEKA